MSTKTRTLEDLRPEYVSRVAEAYRQSLPAALTELAAILAELATQRQPVEERNIMCRCCPDCNGPACTGPCRNRACVCSEVPSLLDEPATVCREPQDIDGLAKLLGGGERLQVIDVDPPAPAPVEAVTTELETLMPVEHRSGHYVGFALLRDQAIAAARRDQLAAVAAARKQDAEERTRLRRRANAAEATIADLRRELAAASTEAARLHQQDEETIAEMRKQVERLTGERDANATAARELARLRELAKAGTSNAKEGAEWRRLLGLADTSGEVERG
jgi:hypothetical protein